MTNNTQQRRTLNGSAKWIGLAVAIVAMAVGYGELRSAVADNTKHFHSLNGVPERLAAIEAKLEILLQRR